MFLIRMSEDGRGPKHKLMRRGGNLTYFVVVCTGIW